MGSSIRDEAGIDPGAHHLGEGGDRGTLARLPAGHERESVMGTQETIGNGAAAEARSAATEDADAAAGLLAAAGDAARETVALAALGAADVTRGTDALAAAQAFDTMGGAVAGKAVRDGAAAAVALDAAGDVGSVAALMEAVSAENLDRGMVLASLSGQMRVASEMVSLLGMPVLSEFLRVKGRQLHGLGVNEIGRAMAAAALSQGMDATAAQLTALGLAQIAEGERELDAADDLLDARDAAVSAGIRTAAVGVAELSAAKAEAKATRQLAAAGVVMVAQGAEQAGQAEAAEAIAATPPKKGATKTGKRKH